MKFKSLKIIIFVKIYLMFKILAKLNKVLLPSLSKSQIDLSRAKKWQKILIAWRYFVTTRSLHDT